MNHGVTPRTQSHQESCLKPSNSFAPSYTKEFMSQVKVLIDHNGFSNSRRMVDYDCLSIYKHSIVSQFEMLAYLPSLTLSLSHSLDIQFTLDLIYSQDMTHEYSIRRAETSLHSKRHSVSCVIHVFLKDSPIQLPNSKIARHSSSKTRFHTQLES